MTEKAGRMARFFNVHKAEQLMWMADAAFHRPCLPAVRLYGYCGAMWKHRKYGDVREKLELFGLRLARRSRRRPREKNRGPVCYPGL
jgi:hypothetical protein